MSTTTAYTPAWYSQPLEAGFQPYYDDNDPKTWYAPGVTQGFSTLADLYVAWKVAGRPLIGALPDSTLTRRESGSLLSSYGGKLFRMSRRPSRLSTTANSEVSSAGFSAAAQASGKAVAAVSGGAPVSPFFAEAQGALGLSVVSGSYVAPTGPSNAQPTYRFVTDTLKLDIQFLAAGAQNKIELFVDNQPLTSGLPLTVSNTWLNIVFSTAKPRLIEIRTTAALGNLTVGALYTTWRPMAATSPRLLIVGDGWLVPPNATSFNRGLYQMLGDEVDLEDVWLDGVAASGYFSYQSRLATHISVAPDVLLVHGGGVADLAAGGSVSDVLTAISSYFRAARLALPSAKLVYVESFLPPGWAAQAAQVAQLNPQVRTALAPYGTHFISDTGTWLTGTGYVGNTKGDGTNDTYISADGITPTDAGAFYLRRRLTQSLLSVLAAA